MFYVLIWDYEDSSRNKFVTDNIEKLYVECLTPENFDAVESLYYDLLIQTFDEQTGIKSTLIQVDDLESLETFKEALK